MKLIDSVYYPTEEIRKGRMRALRWRWSIAACIVLLLGMTTTISASEKSEFIIEPVFEYGMAFDGDVAFFYDENRKVGLMDKTGKVIMEPIYDDIYSTFSEDKAIILKDSAYGFIDRSGNEIIKPIYEEADDFSEGLAAVAIDGKWGYIDDKGNFVVEPQYEFANLFIDGHALVQIGKNQSAIINKNGKMVKQFENLVLDNEFTFDKNVIDGYKLIEDLKAAETYYWTVNKQNKWGIVRLDGVEVIPPTYENPAYNLNGELGEKKIGEQYSFSEEIAVVGREWERSLINMKGEVIANLTQFDGDPTFRVMDLQGGMLGYCVMTGCGFIDKSGKVAIEPKYGQVYSFSDGLAAVNVGSKWGFINSQGDIIIEPEFEAVSRFYNGVAWAMQDGLFGLINTKGEAITDFIYDDSTYDAGDAIEFFSSEGIIPASKDGKQGLLDFEGNELIEFKYAGVGYASEGLVAASLDGEKWGYIAVPELGPKGAPKNTPDINIVDIVVKIILNR